MAVVSILEEFWGRSTLLAAGKDGARRSVLPNRPQMRFHELVRSSVTKKPSGVVGLVKSKSRFLGILLFWGGTAGESPNPDMREVF